MNVLFIVKHCVFLSIDFVQFNFVVWLEIKQYGLIYTINNVACHTVMAIGLMISLNPWITSRCLVAANNERQENILQNMLPFNLKH